MRIRRGQSELKLPPLSDIYAVFVVQKSGNQSMPTHYPLMAVMAHEMETIKKASGSVLGFPVYYTHIGRKLVVHPSAACQYTIKVRYTPPIEEI